MTIVLIYSLRVISRKMQLRISYGMMEKLVESGDVLEVP